MHDCIGPGNPRMMFTPGGLRIIQDRNYNRVYLIFGGGNHGWRTIYMDGRAPPDPEEVTATFYGLAVGRWEGDTLVAESIGFNTRFWFSNGGLPHTEGLRLTERFKRPSTRRARVRSHHRRSAHVHASVEERLDPALGARRHPRAVL